MALGQNNRRDCDEDHEGLPRHANESTSLFSSLLGTHFDYHFERPTRSADGALIVKDGAFRILVSVAVLSIVVIFSVRVGPETYSGPGYMGTFHQLPPPWRLTLHRDEFRPLNLSQVPDVRISPRQAMALAQRSLTGRTSAATRVTESLGSLTEPGDVPPVTNVPVYIVTFSPVWQSASSVNLIPFDGNYSVFVIISARSGLVRESGEIALKLRPRTAEARFTSR